MPPFRTTTALLLAGTVLGLLPPGDPAPPPLPRAALAVTTSVSPAAAAPGDPITQTARVVNTGEVVLVGVVVELDAAPRCRSVAVVLPPGRSSTASCTGPAGRTVLTASARGLVTPGPWVVATASVQLRTPDPAPAPDPGPVAPPAAAPAPAGRAGPPPPRPAVPPAPVPAAPPARAATLPAPPPAPVPPAGPAAGPAPAEPAPVPPRRRPAPAAGPAAVPVRTAAVVAVLGVLVMTVTAGALSAALRIR